tara:strand:+ start:413 stop:1006 length:594 start_codon:yes stop_codon:yes gene_type:complete
MYKHPHVRIEEGTTSGSYTAGKFPDLSALKEHLRVDFSDDDTYIALLLQNTVSYVEEYCGIKFGTTTYTAFWDYAYPVVLIGHKFESIDVSGGALKLERLNDSGRYEDVPVADYTIDSNQNPLRIHMKSGFSSTSEINQYKMVFKAVNISPPKTVYQAALMIAGHFYENRQSVGGDRVYEVPLSSQHLLERYRQSTF